MWEMSDYEKRNSVEERISDWCIEGNIEGTGR
jgi:hypothetical protein